MYHMAWKSDGMKFNEIGFKVHFYYDDDEMTACIKHEFKGDHKQCFLMHSYTYILVWF